MAIATLHKPAFQASEAPARDRLLVVDDDLAQRRMMIRMLRPHGFECRGANSTEEARTLLRTEEFGLVLTDLRMFSEDGLELARYIKDNHPDTYTVLVTGLYEERLEERIRTAGGFGVLPKPLDRDRLLDLVHDALDDRDDKVALRRHQSW